MAHIYMHFDFGADEEKAQQARHKLDVWKQAFRLDKKLLYKLDRPESTDEDGTAQEKSAHDKKSAAANNNSKKRKTSEGAGDSEATGSAPVSLLIRLYFSSHEKLSEQRWLDRIPAEEPFKSASPKVIRENDPEFEKAVGQFSDLGYASGGKGF
ncbi:MAG: hypothetical protein NVS9B4_24510 [Candidatus Acidiferrum sp.]